MANLKETRSRIKSIKSTQKITKAMKMVATAKLKKIRDALSALKEYTDEIETLISQTISRLTDEEMKEFGNHPLIRHIKSHQRNLIILNTSNKGLCGGINNYNLKALKTKVEFLKSRGNEIFIFAIGKKGFDYCQNHYPEMLCNKNPVILEEKSGFNLDTVKSEIYNIIAEKGISSSMIIFTKFVNTTTQKTQEAMLSPILPSRGHEQKEDYHFDSKISAILTRLMPEFMLCKILLSVFENATSEQSARMIAMENATNNASKAIKNLTLIYNRIRQANITREISEIVAGVESLKQV